MKRLLSLCLLVGLVLSVGSHALAQSSATNAFAWLNLADGTTVGSVSFAQTGPKMSVVVQVNGLPPGFLGVQVHAIGACSPSFEAAGDHLDLGGNSHPNHSGDLSPVLVMQDGTASMSLVTDRFTLADVMDADGSAVIISAEDGTRLACGVVEPLVVANANATSVQVMQTMPLDRVATVSRMENAENGVMTLALPALGLELTSQVRSAEAGQIGQVTREGDLLVFTFTEITYNVAPIQLPNGLNIGPQRINLDPNQTSTLTVNVNTGEISRNFFWLLTSTDVLYDGQPTIALGDTARAMIAEIQPLEEGVYAVRLITHWQSNVTLQTWSIGGTTLPSGEIQASAEFEGTYILNFNQ